MLTLRAVFVAMIRFCRASSRNEYPGAVILYNGCDVTYYLWSASDTEGPMYTLAPGKSYEEPYRLNPNQGGISIKISQDQSLNNITQVEYTLDKASSTIWYDISNINGYPVIGGGIVTTPHYLGQMQTSDFSSCLVVNCPPNVAVCPEAYNAPHDDHATRSCPLPTDLQVDICPSQISM